MQIKYVGHIGDGVVVVEPGTGREYGTRSDTGELLGARPGEVIEVPDALGASLLRQKKNWEAIKSAPIKAAKADEGDIK
jgi:hypothetical protein